MRMNDLREIIRVYVHDARAPSHPAPLSPTKVFGQWTD